MLFDSEGVISVRVRKNNCGTEIVYPLGYIHCIIKGGNLLVEYAGTPTNQIRDFHMLGIKGFEIFNNFHSPIRVCLAYGCLFFLIIA